MKDLGKEYRYSIKLLSARIQELETIKTFLVKRTKDPNSSDSIAELEDRLKPLKLMLGDLREVSAEVNGYYLRGHWRNERITLNQRKSRKFVYAGPSRR